MKVCGKLLGVLACLLLLGACAKKEESKDAEFLNVQLEGSEMWSLVNVETGKLEFKNEFFAPATSVVKGSFFVQNKEGLFDLFNLKDTKNRLNSKSYSFVTNFNGGGFAIVRVNDEPWQVINTEGKTIATLDKDLSILSGFSPEGMAIFKNKEDMYGFVNTAGALAIKPRYLAVSPFSGGVAVVKTKEEDGKSFFAVIDEKATELFRFSSAQYSQLSNFNSGYAFALEGENIILLNKQGRKVANVGTGSGIGGLEVSGDAFIYPDRGYYGVKNINDEILIRAKYAYLEFTGDGNLLARDSNGKYGVVDKNDNEVVPFDYSALEYIAPDRYLTTSGSLIILIDAKGKEVGENAFENVLNRSSSVDYLKLATVLSKINNIVKNSDFSSYLNNEDFSMLDFSFDDVDGSAEEEATVLDDADLSSVQDTGAASSEGATGNFTMTGSVGKYPIEMVLKTDGSTVSGYYRYTKSGSGAPINIKGTSHGSMVELEEYSNGKLCGTWRITLTQSGQSVSAMGEMINFKDQSFPVNLKGTKD